MDDDSLRLEAFRTRVADWADLACADDQDAAGLWTDPHTTTRADLLIALQYDPRLDDRPLVAFLLEQEAVRHAREPDAGLHEALERAAFLLAMYREPADVPRLWRAKLANFDTYCGLDVRYLVAAGLPATRAFLRADNDLERAAIRSFLEQYDAARFTPEALDAWWREQTERFPPSLAAETPQARVHRALEAGDLMDVRRWLEAWEAREPPSHALLRQLALAWEHAGDLTRASALQRQIVATVPAGDFATLTRFVALCKLAELQRRDSAFPEAWQTLLEAEQVHREEPDWPGAPRDLAWEAIRLAAAMPPGDALGSRAFAWARAFIAGGCPVSAPLLEEARQVAARLTDSPAVAWLDSLLEQESARTLAGEMENDTTAGE